MENALYAMIEADPSSRRLMIRNVPYTATETSLKQTVEAYGPIEDFKLVIDRNTGERRTGSPGIIWDRLGSSGIPGESCGIGFVGWWFR